MLTMRQVTKATELKRFKELEGEYHYMGETHSGGDTMRLVFEEDGKWVALMVWGSACYHIKLRDAYVGWANSVKAIARFAKRLTMAQRRALCMPRAKSKAGVVAKHEYKVPCHVTLHNFLRALDLDDFGEKLSGWMASQGDGTLPRQLALDGKSVKEVMGVVSVVNAETGAPVAVTEASFPPGAVIARKIEKEESGARLKMR